MSNPIDKNLEFGNNSIIPYSFIWTAKFNNSEDVCQFDFETGEEIRFEEVQKKFDNLEYFLLWNNEKCFTVDLINGLIYFNKELLPKSNIINNKNNLRLVFFRRHRIEFGVEDLKEKIHTIEYHLGFQWNDKLGNNHKIILKIDEKGNFIIGD